MNLRSSVIACLALGSCGKGDGTASGGESSSGSSGAISGGSKLGGPSTWLKAGWKPVEVELKNVTLSVEVPDGLPVNADYMLGKDWWAGAGGDVTSAVSMSGPRLTLDNPRMKAYADAEALARDVEPDAARADLIEITKEWLPDGRLRYVSAVKGNSHLDVTEWIPVDGERGIKCVAHWWAGPGDHDSNHPPDPAILAWLARFCASVKLAPPAAPAP